MSWYRCFVCKFVGEFMWHTVFCIQPVGESTTNLVVANCRIQRFQHVNRALRSDEN